MSAHRQAAAPPRPAPGTAAPGTAAPGPAAGPALPGLPRAGRCLVMGVLNVTPDSFSDGGRFLDPDAAVAQGLALAAEGADIVDVGGESTRPGAARVPAAEERRRVLPVITALAGAGVLVSADTMRAGTAAAALAAGARLVNDVSGGLARAVYGDVVAEVRAELAARVAALTAAGVSPGALILDPGLGFAKRAEHNWALLRALADIGRVGGVTFPVLVAASRKRFLGDLLAGPDGQPRPFPGRDDATVALTALAAAAGAWCVRVHAVAGSADAVRAAASWCAGGAR